jgi:DUF2934 family protein
MIAPKLKTSAQPIAIDSKSSTANPVTELSSASLQDTIRERAYELYESRGREPGYDEDDWLRAEREITKGR